MLSMFLHADALVKIVMLVLVLFSVASWAIIFKKYYIFKKQTTDIKEVEEWLSSHRTNASILDVISNSTNVISHILCYGLDNARFFQNKKAELCRLVDSELHRTIYKLDTGMDFLTIIGTSSPLIGLLGATWSAAKSLQALPVGLGIEFIAPNIAEALFVVVLGLAVAIPANIFRSRFSALIEKISAQLSNIIRELMAVATHEECEEWDMHS